MEPDHRLLAHADPRRAGRPHDRAALHAAARLRPRLFLPLAEGEQPRGRCARRRHARAVRVLAPDARDPSRHQRQSRRARTRRHRHAHGEGVSEPLALQARALPHVPEPAHAPARGADLAVHPQAPDAAGYPARLEARDRRRAGHEHRARGAHRAHDLYSGAQDLPDGAAPHHAHRRLDRRFPLLRAASVRGHLLALPREVELLRRRPRGRVAPRDAEDPPVGHRQHRPASHPSHREPDPELRAAARVRQPRGAAPGHAPLALEEREHPAPHPLG